MTNYSKKEFAALVPCQKKDVSKLVAKKVIEDLNDDAISKAREWFEINGPYQQTPYCKVCGAEEKDGVFHRHCTKCGCEANGFAECEKSFGFSYVKKYNHRKVRPVCRECHRLYRESPEEVKGKTVTTVKEKAKARKAKKKAEEEQLAEVAAAVALPVEKINFAHRHPLAATVEADETEEIPFGPVSLTSLAANTVEGATMVPEVDEHFKMDAQEAIIIANALKNAEPTWIWGPSGVGKTSGVKQVAAILNWPVYRVQMSADFSLDDFVGTTEVIFDAKHGAAITEFRDGVLVRAMLNGGILLIDEFTGTPPHILLALQAVLERVENPQAAWDDGKPHCKFVNTANGGEVIHAHPNFRIIVTDNTNGQGDLMGTFAGTNVMNEATRSRFTQWFHKGFPSSAVWTQILMNKCPGLHAKKAQSIVEIATTVNNASRSLGAKTAACDLTINPRDTLAVARMSMVYQSVNIAFRVGILNGIDPTDPDRTYLENLVKNVVGSH